MCIHTQARAHTARMFPDLRGRLLSLQHTRPGDAKGLAQNRSLSLMQVLVYKGHLDFFRDPGYGGSGLDKLGFLHSHNISSPDPQPRPPEPDAEVRLAAQIPAAPVAVTGISTGNGRPEHGGAWPSPLPAWLQFCLCKHLFFKNDFCCLADTPPCSLSLSPSTLHTSSPHI